MLIGIVDPSHYEREHDKPGRLPNWFTTEELLLASSAPNPKWSPWTHELIVAALREHQERGDHISTTALVASCPRSEVLKRRVDYIESLDSMYAALRGTMIHRTLEHSARLGAIAEARFYVTVDGIELSCSPDLLTTDTLFDYKVPTDQTGVPSFGYPFRHQTEQLMTNAFITRHAERWDYEGPLPFDPREFPAEHVVIVYLGPKTPKIIEYERREKFETPAGVMKEAKRPYVWNDEEALTFIRPRIHLFENALNSYPDWPDPWTDAETGETFHAEDTYEENKRTGKQDLVPGIWGGPADWRCPGDPLCKLPSDLARRDPSRYAWPKQVENDKAREKRRP